MVIEMIDIPGFPDYKATSDGDIVSFKGKTPRTLRPTSDGRYLQVTLRRDGKSFARRVHILVALAYHGPCPEGEEVRHGSGGKTDNRPENLSYGTHSANQLDQIEHGTHYEANKTHCAQGHLYSENTMPPLKGKNARRCRKCHAIWQARWRAKKRSHVTASHTASE